MYFATSIMMLGYTRINGVQAYNNVTREFNELTPAQARKLIEQGNLKGVLWKNNEDGGAFVCDVDGWNQQEILVRTACGKFRPLVNDLPGRPINSIYTVVRVLDTDYRGRLFEVVSNTCARIKIEEQNLRELAAITTVAGVWITDTGIDLAEDVVYEDRRAICKATDSEPLTLDDVFGACENNDSFMGENTDTEPEEPKKEEVKQRPKKKLVAKGKRK